MLAQRRAPESMTRPLGVLWLALVVAACSGCGQRSRQRDAERAAQVARCVDGLGRAMSHGRGTAIDALVESCPEACPGLGTDISLPGADLAQATRVVASCSGFCSPEAEAAWRQAPPDAAFATLVGACGADAFALDPSRAPLISDSWLLLVRTFQWLQNNQRHAAPEIAEKLAQAGDYTHFSLPLPARVDALYAVPAARARRPLDSVMYVVVASGDAAEVRAAARPIVRLRTTGVEQRPVPGGPFPGQLMTPEGPSHAQLFAEFAELHPPDMRARMDPRPAVFIDARAPIARLVRAMRQLDVHEFYLAVSGPTAGVHPIAVQLLAGSSAAPVLRVEPEHIALVGTREVRIPRADVARVRAELDDLSVASAPLDKVELVLPEAADMSALIEALDLVATSKFATALVR